MDWIFDILTKALENVSIGVAGWAAVITTVTGLLRLVRPFLKLEGTAALILTFVIGLLAAIGVAAADAILTGEEIVGILKMLASDAFIGTLFAALIYKIQSLLRKK